MARVTREHVDDGVVYDDRRTVLAWNPVTTLVGLLVLGLLIWAIFWGPIAEIFDGDGDGGKVNVDTPNVQVND